MGVHQRHQRDLMSALTLSILIITLMTLFRLPGASAQQSPEQQLAETYAPILMLKQQTGNCDRNGEGYFPTTVDWLWHNPDINLMVKGHGGVSTDSVLKNAPSAQDLVDAGPETYLDFPGDPRNPGCTYETYFKQKAAALGLQPTIYAKFVYAPAERRLYLEYWSYFFFNDWNNTHESDWELLALAFNADSAAEALKMEPSWVGYAQHGSGESAQWTGDDKLQRDGDHPIAYLSAGSHATYYNQNTMIGWGENDSAFGCDVTTAPSVEVRPQVEVIPDLVDPKGPFAWTLFQGAWGQRETGIYSGPAGPNMGKEWDDPAAAFRNWRTSPLTIPSSEHLGINATNLFCTLSKNGSRALVYFEPYPWRIGLLALATLVLVGLSIWKVWGFFLEALDIYGNDLRTFLGIGALAVPFGLLFNAFRVWAADKPPMDRIEQFFNNSNAGQLADTLVVAVFQQVAMLLLIAPAIIFAMKEIRAGYKPGVWRSYLGAWKRLPSLILAVVALGIILAALSWTILLIPIALYVGVRLQFFSYAIILDNARGLTEPLAKSWRITRGHWFKTLLLTLAFQLLASLPAPLIGIIVLIIGGSNVRFANSVSSLLYSFFMPLSAIGITLAYRRLNGQLIIEPHVVTRERDPKKAAASQELREEAARQQSGDA